MKRLKNGFNWRKQLNDWLSYILETLREKALTASETEKEIKEKIKWRK